VIKLSLIFHKTSKKISARVKKEKIAWVKIEKTSRLAEERFGRI